MFLCNSTFCLGSADKNLDHLGLVIARDAASRTPSFKAVFAALQEDAHLAALDVDGSSSVFGVFDGHGGREVAKFVSLYLVCLHSRICIVMTSAKVCFMHGVYLLPAATNKVQSGAYSDHQQM